VAAFGIFVGVWFAHERLPNDVRYENCNVKPGASVSTRLIGGAALSMASWDIDDYIVFKTAKGSILGEEAIELIADPITGKWSLLKDSK
jgi:hypothetical protein